jgi:signal transduction histidine kinase
LAYGQNKELLKLKYDLSKAKDSLTVMRLMNKIGFLIHMNSADSSFYYGVKANRIANSIGDIRGKADALANIAIGLSLKGLYSQSLDYYSKAYQNYAQLPDTGEMAQMLMNSAISYSFTSDSNQTKQFAKRAVLMSKWIKVDSVKSMLYANYAELGGLKPDAANIYLNKAEIIALKAKDDRTLLFIMQERAQSFLDTKNFPKAKALIFQSLYLARKHQWDYHELEALNLYGSYYLAVNNLDSALDCYQQIYRISNANNYVYWKVDVLRSILHVYELKYNLPKQVESNKLLVEALDKQNESNNSFLGDYIKYNTDQQKLEKLKQLNAINQKTKNWFIIATAIGLITTIVIFLIYLRSRKQQKLLHLLNEKISDQNRSLQDNDEFKSRLLSMLAHDFRAPLGQTLGIISLLREDELDRDTRIKSYDSIENDLENILVTFDSILQWIKRQLSGYEFIPEELNMYDLMKHSASLFKQTMSTKSLIFNNLLDPEQIVSSDREIIQFINRNLIHNAVKYSPVNGVISASIKTNRKEVIISVKNEGKGMTEKQLNNLFLFRQHETDDQGAGMALTLSREFIMLLNGKIWAESSIGDGATFYYSLPI